MSKKLFIKTYGCQMNVYDSEKMQDVMAGEDYQLVDSPDGADLVILNTCHIREKASEKLYSDVGRLRPLKEAKEKSGGAMTLAVSGCVAQAEGPEMLRRSPLIDLVVGPQAYHRLPALLKERQAKRARGEKGRLVDTDFPAVSKFDQLTAPRQRRNPAAFLTVQEGCDKFCTFCVVPYTRGAEYSRPVSAIISEAEKLAKEGVVEITLLGQNVNAFHGEDEDGNPVKLGILMKHLAAIDGIERLRYTTSHPRDMTDDLIAAHRDMPACMPYLHLPVQSGSDRILKAMNRHHTRESYLALLAKLRVARPDIALSGDFIVGFPGESDADFEDTLDLVRQVGYAQAYSFKYSPRPGTPAAEMSNQVPEAIKIERLARLQTVITEGQIAFNEATIGRVLPVLFEREGKKPGQYIGRSPYMQSVYLDLSHLADKGLSLNIMGQLIEVEIVSAGPNSVSARLPA